MTSLKQTARVSGLFYLILAITGGYGIMYVPTQLVVANDIALTTNNILNNEFFFRTGIMSNLIAQTVFVFLVLALYRLFEKVDLALNRTMLALVLVAVPISFFIIFNQLYALLLLKEEFMKTIDPVQMQTLTMALLKMYDYGNSVIGIFWGLWLIPFGQLAYKSGFIPKIIGILLILGGLVYVMDAFVFVLFPEFRSVTNMLVAVLSSIAELSTVFWLLIKGTTEQDEMVLTSKSIN